MYHRRTVLDPMRKWSNQKLFSEKLLLHANFLLLCNAIRDRILTNVPRLPWRDAIVNLDRFYALISSVTVGNSHLVAFDFGKCEFIFIVHRNADVVIYRLRAAQLLPIACDKKCKITIYL
jgi:hypothetical protein